MEDGTVASTKPAGYLAVPESGSGPGILVLHAWWGLTPFFQSICDRLAATGFVAFAPDLHQGKTAQTIEEAKQLMAERDFAVTRATVLSAVEYMQQLPAVSAEGLGVIGWSMGGAWAMLVSTIVPEAIRAAVIFYGTGDPDFTQATAAFLGHFAEQDEWDSLDDVRQMEAAMRQAGVELTLHVYPGVGHWFFEEDKPAYYDPPAAALAWQRTIEFLRTQLSNG